MHVKYYIIVNSILLFGYIVNLFYCNPLSFILSTDSNKEDPTIKVIESDRSDDENIEVSNTKQGPY
jgi:hypothetical protein